MYPRQSVPDGLALLARLQAGVLSREQALGHGFSQAGIRRLLAEGSWQRMAPGIYFVGSLPPAWVRPCLGRVLIGGDQARLDGLAAAHLHGLSDTPPQEILVLVPASGAARTQRPPWRFSRERVGARPVRTVGGPPRITVADTVLDLAAGPDPAVAVHWITAAVQARLTTADRLRRAMHRRHFVPQRRLLETLLTDVVAGVRSPLELAYLRDVERAHGLPIGIRQHARAKHRGRRPL